MISRSGRPTRAMVTGAAGFIGSHLCERLLQEGYEVIAVDKLTDYYDPDVKRANLAGFQDRAGVAVLLEDVASPSVQACLDRVDVVFHLAAQPGVRPSWDHFPTYLRENVEAVHRLLESARHLRRPPRIVLASSSSVYGDAATYPCHEGSSTAPASPYGVSKLSMEQLVNAYCRAFDLRVVMLRYFTVYGPRQRPDMAFHRFLDAALHGTPVPVLGDGDQVRQFTYVADVVEATLRAGSAAGLARAEVLNVCGGEPVTVNEVLELMGSLLGRPVKALRAPSVVGDVRRTGGDGSLALARLGWRPRTTLRAGLQQQLHWHQSQLARDADAAGVLAGGRTS